MGSRFRHRGGTVPLPSSPARPTLFLGPIDGRSTASWNSGIENPVINATTALGTRGRGGAGRRPLPDGPREVHDC